MKTKLCLVISPPADFRAALVLVDTDIRGGEEFVSNVATCSNTSTATDEDDGVCGNILEPDGLVVDGVNSLLGVVPARSTVNK